MALKILIVDDSITVRAVLGKALRMTDLDIDEIVQAGNGLEALAALDEYGDFDIVFTDIIMPEMDGEKFVGHLHRTGRTKDLPVVVVSSAGDTERIARLRELGARGFIHKPFTPEQIQEIVVEHTGIEV